MNILPVLAFDIARPASQQAQDALWYIVCYLTEVHSICQRYRRLFMDITTAVIQQSVPTLSPYHSDNHQQLTLDSKT